MSAGKVGRAALDDDGRSGCGKATGGEAAGIAGSFEADRVVWGRDGLGFDVAHVPGFGRPPEHLTAIATRLSGTTQA